MPPKRSTRSAANASASKIPAAAKKPTAKPSTRAPAAKATKPRAKKATTPTPAPALATSGRSTRSKTRAGSVALSVASIEHADSLEARTAPGSIEPENFVQTIEEDPIVSSYSTIDYNNTFDDNVTVDDNTTVVTTFDETALKTDLVPIEEEQNAVATIEESDEQDGMPPPEPISMERVLEGPASLISELTLSNSQDIIMSMCEEITYLRNTVEELSQKTIEPAQPSPGSPEVYRHMMRSAPRDLRFYYTVEQPAAALKKKEEDEQKARQEQEEQRAREEQEAAAAQKQEEQQTTAQLSLQAPSPKISHTSTPPNKQTTMVSTPASGWGLPAIFGTITKKVFGRAPTPAEHMLAPWQQQSESHQEPQQETESQTLLDTHTPVRAKTPRPGDADQSTQDSSPISPSTTPTDTPSIRQRQRKSRQQHQTPSATEGASATPQSRVQRRRGLLPGTPNVSRTPRSQSKPVETNADKREALAKQNKARLEAENAEIAREMEMSRKIIEQNRREREQQREGQKEYKMLDAQDTSEHQVGEKRKRVNIDELEAIPRCRPGQGSGCFSLRDEFFVYDDEEEDGPAFVELDAAEADALMNIRPAKKMRIEDNVFQSITPQKPAPTPAATTPSTPSSNSAQLAAAERQRLQASQHKPKRPSGLRQVSTGISPVSVGPTPQQISAATPAPLYFNTPGGLTDITEMTEPETPVAITATPSPAVSAPKLAAVAPVASASPSNSFGFPAGVDLWVAYPHIFTKEQVERELAVPITPEAIASATREFAAGCAARLAREQQSPLLTA